MKSDIILTGAGLKREIQESHDRSEQYGISREIRSSDQKRLSPVALEERRKANRTLLELVSGYIGEVYTLLSPERFMMAMVDHEGFILYLAGDDNLKAEFAERNCTPGYCWTERNVGTTAISLCLKKQVAVQLNDEEHYCKVAHGFTSCAAPIFGDDEILQGVIVVSGRKELVHPHTLVMVVSAARSIEKHMRLLRQHREMSLYTGFLNSVVESAETGIIALDQEMRIWRINRKGTEILRGALLKDKPISVLKGLGLDIDAIHDNPSAWKEKECTIHHQQQVIQVIFSAQPVFSSSQERLGAVVVFEEVGNIRKLAERISGAKAYFTFDHLIGSSPAFLEAVTLAKRAARSDSTVLLLGETGTGKELFAQAIHNAGRLREAPFIPINCGAIPGELMESELFGYVDGAFTGALKGGRPGKFELADGGTLLLDEIGDMPHDMQVKLLRVLQMGEVQRIGSDKMVKIHTRIVASTHVNLAKAIEENRFRQDLFYRLNILPITIPPLRERGPEDIAALAEYFVKKISPRVYLSSEALDLFTSYPWPGNVRELENTIQRALHCCDGKVLEIKHLGLSSQSPPSFHATNCPVSDPIASPSKGFKTLKEMEQQLISSTLEATAFNMAMTAKRLGISRATLYRKVKIYNIQVGCQY